jgi:hypothetical protein
MLLSDADRDALIETLGRHAAAGRLAVPELERRVEVVMLAASREDAVAVLADLPPLPASPPSGAGPAARRRWGKGHGEADQVAPDWQPTSERFRDPKSGRVMRVWVDSAGARHYVADERA